jgi:hypothetical protein
MKTEGNIIYFDNDEEFYEWALDPTLKIRENDNGTLYYDIDFSREYENAIAKDQHFVIKDENSVIEKRQSISYKLITKPIKNLDTYYGE